MTALPAAIQSGPFKAFNSCIEIESTSRPIQPFKADNRTFGGFVDSHHRHNQFS